MATYTIRTTRQQEIGLKYSYDTYADKTKYPTQAEYFQSRIDALVTNPMWNEQQLSQLKDFDASFKTIPELEQPAANAEIQDVIIAHGGTIVSVVPPGSTPPAPPGPTT